MTSTAKEPEEVTLGLFEVSHIMDCNMYCRRPTPRQVLTPVWSIPQLFKIRSDLNPHRYTSLSHDVSDRCRHQLRQCQEGHPVPKAHDHHDYR